MTAVERNNMEKLAEEAIRNAYISNDDWKSYEKHKADGHVIEAEVKMREADYHRGYAEGIRQSLAVMGCKSERMKQLDELLE